MTIGDRAKPLSSHAFSVRVAAFYGALFVIYGAQLPFLPLWLETRGLTPAEIGIATSLPLLLRILVAPSIAATADRTDGHAQVARVLAAFGVAAAVLLPAAYGALGISIVVLVFMVAVQSTMPLVETIAMRGVRTADLDYGRMRLWGSVTFIATNLAGGLLIDGMGRDAIAGLLIFGTVLTLVAAFFLPSPLGRERRAMPAAASATDSAIGRVRSSLRPAGRVLGSPTILLLLLATGAIQASHAIVYTFGAVHWRSQDLGTPWIGALWAIGVVAEVALFAYSAAAVRAFGALGLLAIGGGAGVVRWIVMAFDPPLALLVPLQVLHAATFGATHLAGMHLISQFVDERDAGMAQTLSATSIGVVMGVVIAASGPLYAVFGARSYVAMAVLAALGLAAVAVLARSQARAVSA